MITPLPSAPATTDSTATFNNKAFALVGALDDFVTETNALAVTVIADAAIASSSVSTSSASASTATTKAAEAVVSAAAALASLNLFKGQYYGALSANPTLDPLGAAMTAGDLYLNTTVPEMRVYTGSAWVAAYANLASALLVANNLSDLASVSAARANLGLVIGTNVQAFDAAAAKTNIVQAFTKAQSFTPVALTSASSSIAIDLSLSNNFTHTLTENTVLANPTNLVAGQSGRIKFTNHASSPKTIAFGSYWLAIGGVVQSLTASNSAVDMLVYEVDSATTITFKLLKDRK